MSEDLAQHGPDVTTLRVSFNTTMRNLPQVARTLTALDELWAVANEVALLQRSLQYERFDVYERGGPYWYARGFPGPGLSLEAVPRPESVRVSLASPLVVELAGTLQWPLIMGATTGTLRFLIKNADAVGSCIPRMIEAWYGKWTDAYEARLRWQGRRGLPLPEFIDQLTTTGQQAGQTLAEADPSDPEITGPGADWTPPWDDEAWR